MKWYIKALLAAGLAVAIPATASAQPAPPKHGSAKPAPAKPGKGHAKPAPAKPAPAKPAPAKPAPATPAPHPGPAHVKPAPVQPFPNAKPINHPQPVPPNYRAEIHGMHPHEFADLLNRIDRANFKDDRIRIVRDASHQHKFTSEQVRIVLTHLQFENNRIDAACALYPVVVDRKNWDVVYSALEFPHSRDRIHRDCIH